MAIKLRLALPRERIDIVSMPTATCYSRLAPVRDQSHPISEIPLDRNPLIVFLRRALEQRSSGVIYRDLAASLSQAITEDVLATGDGLPGERDLADAIDVSRTSVRKAIDALVGEGILIRRHGARTAVAQRLEKPLSTLTSFSEDMRSRGVKPGSVWISREVASASPVEIMALNLSVGARVCRLNRLRTGDGKPMAIEHAVVPADVLDNPELVVDSLYDVLAERDRRPVRGLQRVRAAVAGPEDGRLLHIEVGAPLLVAERRCFGRDGAPVEFTRTRYCGERYDFLVELRPRDETRSVPYQINGIGDS